MQISDVTQVVARAAVDAAAREDLMKNPAAVLNRAGIALPAGMSVKVYQNDAKTFHAVLPVKGDAATVAYLKKSNPVAAKVFEKAWSDPAYKARLFSEPRKAFVEATGVTPPAGMTLVPHEDSATSLNIVLPLVGKAGELSDADLEHIAGGKGDVSRCNDAMSTAGGIGAEIAIDGFVAGGGPTPAGAIMGGIGAIGGGLAVAGAALASLFK